MTIRKKIKNIKIWKKIDTNNLQEPPIIIVVEPNSKTILNDFEVCAIAWGQNSYNIFHDFLPEPGTLYFKNSAEDKIYNSLQDFKSAYSDEKIFMCSLSSGLNTSTPNFFVLEYYFEGDMPISILSTEVSWFNVGKIELHFHSSAIEDVPVEHANENTDAHADGEITGLYFPNSSFDPIRSILADYYDTKCSIDRCIVINEPLTASDWGKLPNGKITKENLESYWNKKSKENADIYLSSAMIKHDKSASATVKYAVPLALNNNFEEKLVTREFLTHL